MGKMFSFQMGKIHRRRNESTRFITAYQGVLLTRIHIVKKTIRYRGQLWNL